jgi:hypothetical protein
MNINQSLELWLEVKQSTILHAGKGMFALRQFFEGDPVTVCIRKKTTAIEFKNSSE